MKSITSCIMKAGKAISKADASAIKGIYKDYTDDGMPGAEAAEAAMSDFLGVLSQEKRSILDEAITLGAAVPAGDALKYSIDTKSDTPSKLSIISELYGENKGQMIPGMTKKKTIKDLAKLLSSRARKLNRGKAFSARTARNKEIVSEAMVLETLEAMKQTGHAGNWYSQVLRDALAVAGTLHPEINTDPAAKAAFIFGMAITSNGMSMPENTRYAEKVYAAYKRNGEFPIFGTGAEGGAMKKAFKLFNDLKSKWGMKTLVEFMNTDFTVGELKILGLSVSGENADTAVKGSAIFGPKVGGGFFQNLSGNFTPLTMDRWWMRTWGRMVGNLAPEGLSAAQSQADNFLATLDAASDVVEAHGYTVDEIQNSDKKMMALATKLHQEYARNSFKDRSDINRAAKLLDTAVNFPIVAPRNGTERQWIREVVGEAQRKLAERGYETDTASLQALLWYPEKEFYLQNGVGNERSKPTDYAQEITKLAKSRGVTQSGIDAAVAAARAGQPAGDVAAPGTDTGQAGRGPALAAKERQLLIQDAALRFIRGLPSVFVGRPPKGAARELNGAPVIRVHTLVLKAKNKLVASGLAAPEFRELESGPESAAVFHSRIRNAREGFDPMVEEYENMRLFLAPDGKSGFAIDGDKIVALFKHPSYKAPGLVFPALMLASEQGGRLITTEANFSQYAYAKVGFRTVARTSGAPDQLYLVYDKDSYAHTPGDGTMVDNEVEALALQKATRDALEPNAPKNIRYRLEDEPDTPMRSLNRVSKIMSDQVNNPASSGSVVDWIKGKAHGKNAANTERALALIPRRNLKDFVRGDTMPSVGEYLRTANRMDGRTNELFEVADDLGKRWSKYTSADKSKARVLGELMHSATLLGTDPSVPYKPLKKVSNMNAQDKAMDAKRREQYASLQKWWNKMDEEGQSIFKEVRDAYKAHRKLVEAAINKRIDESEADPDVKRSVLSELRKQFEAGRVAGPYFPLARFGELWGSAKDAEGNTVAFSKFETVSERREWAAALRAAGYEVDTGKQMDNKDIVSRIDPKFATKVADMARGVDPALADEIWQLYLSNMPEMSMRKSFIHRKGRLGFSANAIRAFGHAMFHGAHQIAKLEYGHTMEGQLEQMREEVRAMEKAGHPDEFWGNAVYREMNKRHEWAMKPTDSNVASKLTALGFAWYLGATPAAALVNLSQTAIVAFPVLAAKFSWTGAGLELNKAAALWAGTRGNIENRLRGDERAAMDEARKVGIFSKTQGHDLAGLSEGGVDYSSKMAKAMTVVSWMFHKAEQANREITFLAAYRLGRKDGLSHDDAIVTGEDLVWDSHFDYNSTNRPRLMQSDFAKVILLFRQYSLNMTYRLARDFRESFLPSKASKKERSEARQRLGGIMMMTAMFAGAVGQPMAWAVSGILDALLGSDDEPYDSETALRVYLTEMYGAKAAEAIMKGPTDAFVGATMSSRVSLSHLWIREAPRHLEGAKLYDHYLGEVVGPVLSIPKDLLMGAAEIAQGEGMRGAERLFPKVVKDGLKALRYLREGVQNRRGDVILGEEEMTKKDIFFQAIGFTPARLTMQYEQNRAVSAVARQITDRRSALMDRLFLAWRHEDKSEAKETMQEIAAFNKVNPGVTIQPDNIVSSAKTRAKYSERSIGGVTLPPGLSHLHRRNRFTPRPEGE